MSKTAERVANSLDLEHTPYYVAFDLDLHDFFKLYSVYTKVMLNIENRGLQFGLNNILLYRTKVQWNLDNSKFKGLNSFV